MKQIQPHWYLFAALLILVPVVYRSHTIQEKIVETEKVNAKLESLGRYIKDLEKNYNRPEKNRKKLISLLKRVEKSKDIKIDKNIKKRKANFKIVGIKKSDLEMLVKGVFNSTMRVKRLDIDRSDLNKTRLEAEVIF
jgi:phosphotransacetylase